MKHFQRFLTFLLCLALTAGGTDGVDLDFR